MAARLNLRILLILLFVALVMIASLHPKGIVPVYAQEATPAVEPTAAIDTAAPETRPVAGAADAGEGQATNGVTTLVLLIGLGAVALVGFGTLMRENYRPPQG
jgi:hypothetical protein